jgi:hypothetical protein
MKRYLVALFLFGLSVSGFAHAQCAAFPCVVGSVALLDQTAAVSQVPLFTPHTSGLFRVSGYLESAAVKGSIWAPSFSWVDDLKIRHIPFPVVTPGSYTNFASSLPVRGVAGQPITYTVMKGQNNPGSYSLFITVEQLQ